MKLFVSITFENVNSREVATLIEDRIGMKFFIRPRKFIRSVSIIGAMFFGKFGFNSVRNIRTIFGQISSSAA